MLLLSPVHRHSARRARETARRACPRLAPGPSPQKDGLEPVRLDTRGQALTHAGATQGSGGRSNAALQSHRGRQQTRRGTFTPDGSGCGCRTPADFVKETALLGPEVKVKCMNTSDLSVSPPSTSSRLEITKFMLLVEASHSQS